MKSYFYPQSTYTSILAFSELFNDLTVRVYDNKNEIVGIKPVPLTLTPKEKIASILSTTHINDIDPQVDNYLPRISINLTGMEFDKERMRGKGEHRLLNIEYNEDTKKRSMQIDVQPIPYILNFEVTIWTKYLVDGLQLIEYLTSYFAPQMYVSFKERNFGLEHKSKVTLDSVSPNFVYELGESERRIITWNMRFSMETVIYKPMEIAPEILCSIITIANVPCKRVPFAGSKIVAYEPITNSYESITTKSSNMYITSLDGSESYDKMAKYWKMANNIMGGQSDTCTTDNCSDPYVGTKPIFDSSIDSTSCAKKTQYPCISIDISGNIINYWQELNTGSDNVIRILSYKRVYDPKGLLITGPEVIPISSYPDNCYPVYSAPITSIPITSVVITSSPITSAPITSNIIYDTCINPPNYNTSG
jgi:hypothetical protein